VTGERERENNTRGGIKVLSVREASRHEKVGLFVRDFDNMIWVLEFFSFSFEF
jgi:hypothetical protein